MTMTTTPSVLALPGPNLALAQADELRDTINSALASGGHRLVLDFGQVRMVDSAILGILISSLRMSVSRGGDLKLAGLHPSVSKILELMRLNRVFDVHTTVESALSAFEP